MNKKAQILMGMALMPFSQSGGIQSGIDLAKPFDRTYPPKYKTKYIAPIEPPKTRRSKYKKKRNRAGK